MHQTKDRGDITRLRVREVRWQHDAILSLRRQVRKQNGYYHGS